MSNSDNPKYRESDATRETSEGDGRSEKPSQKEVDKGADSIIANKGKWNSGSDRGPDFTKAGDGQRGKPEQKKWSTGSADGPNFKEAYERDLDESDKD